jgi:hypothetical protein
MKHNNQYNDLMYLIHAMNIAYCFEMITAMNYTCTDIVKTRTSDDKTKITYMNKQK